MLPYSSYNCRILVCRLEKMSFNGNWLENLSHILILTERNFDNLFQPKLKTNPKHLNGQCNDNEQKPKHFRAEKKSAGKELIFLCFYPFSEDS